MKFNIYSVKDVEKGTYLQPFFLPFYYKNEDVLVDFRRGLRKSHDELGNFPDEFELWKIGEFMDETAMFIECSPVKICRASDVLKENDKDVGNAENN